jgi:hypothetical protein
MGPPTTLVEEELKEIGVGAFAVPWREGDLGVISVRQPVAEDQEPHDLEGDERAADGRDPLQYMLNAFARVWCFVFRSVCSTAQ